MTACFHCGELVPRGEHRTVRIDGAEQPVCCAGCQAVATFIRDSGLDDFYQFRQGPSPQPEAAGPDQWSVYDAEELQADFVRPLQGEGREAALLIEGITCAACSWLIEHALRREPGVIDIQVNPATGRALLRWDAARRPLSELLRQTARLGYQPHPMSSDAAGSLADRERRGALKRLGVAGLGMMQVMMYAVALYVGAFQGIEPVYEQFLRLVSMFVATPVLLYAGAPFFRGAWRDLQARRPGMDTPVALAIGGAYGWSLYVTFFGGAEVYFDSVTMFVFFLSLGRYAEMAARHRAAAAGQALAELLPASAVRLEADCSEQRIPAKRLAAGDTVLIRPGETVPADGVIVQGESRLDESMLTGEPDPVPRRCGERLVGGSLNLAHPLHMQVERTGADTVVSAIGRLLERAQAERPRVARLSDRVAGWFVLAVLGVSAAVGLWWLQHDPGRALPVVLATLVVTCPCALSLATPTALTAATGRLARQGLLISRGNALESLARVSHVVFDKTGTLTRGRPVIEQVQRLGQLPEAQCLAYAAALERGSEHPLARAFRELPRELEPEAVQNHPGRGVEGYIEAQRLRIGSPAFVAELAGPLPEGLAPQARVVLGGEQGWLAAFQLADAPRPEAAAAVRELQQLGLQVAIASGDAPGPVTAIAGRLGIEQAQARLTPADKLAYIARLQQQGATVAMVGDGINDAPVLAGADVSLAMGSGTALARSSADAVLLSERLTGLTEGIGTARRALRIIRQNLAWALIYNLVALPLAVSGLIAPWMAAIGMSASSLLVVMNSLRLTRGAAPAACPPSVARAVREASG